MALTASQLAARAGRLTASRVGILMSGDTTALHNLWQEMLGEREGDDLSAVWPVQLGVATEAVNLAWYSRTTGHALSRQGEVVICPRADWAACTLDAFDEELRGPIEAKHVGGFEPRERIVARYTPQVFWQMRVTDTDRAALSIIEGAREPTVEIVEYDESYAEELWWRAEAFMNCVWNLTPPCALPPVAAPLPQEQWRERDMTGNNAWGAFAADWVEHRAAAKAHEKACKELKALVEPDVGRAYGHGICIKRAKNNALSISAWSEG